MEAKIVHADGQVLNYRHAYGLEQVEAEMAAARPDVPPYLVAEAVTLVSFIDAQRQMHAAGEVALTVAATNFCEVFASMLSRSWVRQDLPFDGLADWLKLGLEIAQKLRLEAVVNLRKLN